jgi:hypothetical protein
MDYARLSSKHWRPITFEGVQLPPTFMAISVLASLMREEDEELEGWLWRFPICCGVTKAEDAEVCRRCAQCAMDFMLEHRDQVLQGIASNLGEEGFISEDTFSDWMLSLMRIAEVTKEKAGPCWRSAPSHPTDTLTRDVLDRFLDHHSSKTEHD